MTSAPPATSVHGDVALPHVRITYCTQCRWMLRAAYFAQELLTTFGTAVGEVALVPATGGVFTVVLTHIPCPTSSSPAEHAEPDTDTEAEVEAQTVLLWDRKTEGGFPETKVLKQRLRDHIQPGKDLGHSDRKPNGKAIPTATSSAAGAEGRDGVAVREELPDAGNAGGGDGVVQSQGQNVHAGADVGVGKEDCRDCA